jgi:hypothetical protein
MGEKASFALGDDQEPQDISGVNGVRRMDEKQEEKKKWAEIGIKIALSLAATFPIYFLFYMTFPASIFALYLISAALFAIFAPWDEIKKRFLS